MRMLFTSVGPGGWVAGAMLLVVVALGAPVAITLAAGPDVYAESQVVAQIPTPTPFRFLTPTPFAPGTTTVTSATPPRAGGFPLEMAVPVLVGGLTAIGGGSFLLRRKTTR